MERVLNKEINNKKLEISKTSIIALLFICIIIVSGKFIFMAIRVAQSNLITALLMTFLFVMPVTSFVLSIIDLKKKDRKKVLSIITLVISSLILAVWLLVFIALYSNVNT